MANNNPIGFFDSGIGLISVLKETKKILPFENFAILADQAHNPFGEKTKDQIKKFTADATSYLVKKHKIKMIVIACNTATVLGLDYLREKFSIPTVGTVPAVKVAFSKSSEAKVAIMSTPATAKSQYLDNLINKFGSKSLTLKIACTGLEEAIEILDKNQIETLIKKYIKPIIKFRADIVVLGCTHYPLVKNKIRKNLSAHTKIIDSSLAISKRVRQILLENNLQAQKRQRDFYYTTGDPRLFSQTVSKLLKSNIQASKV